jgi:hypothetical protein
MTNTKTAELCPGTHWPPEKGELVSFQSSQGRKTGVLQEVRWGLVWRDFVLDDGRVIAEHKVEGCPQPPAWRDPDEVSPAEREACEERLVFMAESGLDPRDREQSFWAELNQYLAYTYLRYKRAGVGKA